MNKDLEAVGEWATNNKMLINANKTKSLLVTGKHIAKKLNDDVTPSLRSTPLCGLCNILIFLVQRVSSNGGNLCVIQPEIMLNS